MIFGVFMRFVMAMVNSVLRHPPRPVFILAIVMLACGPRTGDGANDAGASSPTGEGTSSVSATSADDPTGGLDCSASDLPPPFCHRRVPFEAEVPSSRSTIAPTPPVGWRPLVTRGSELRVVDFETSEVLGLASLDGWNASQGVIGPGVFFADVDGNGIPEVGIPTSRDVVPFVRLPDLQPMAEIPYMYVDSWHRGAHGPLDIDRDGTDEIVVHPGVTASYEVWSYHDGEFVRTYEAEEVHEWGGCVPTWVTTGDIDGDGYPELLFAEGERACEKNQGSGGYDPEGDRVAVLSGAPGATRPTFGRFPMGFVASRVYVGDFDGDGRDDVLVRGESSTHLEYAVLFADGEGGLEEPVIMDFGEYDGGLHLHTGDGAIGDFDRSGKDKVYAGLSNDSTSESGAFLVGLSRDGIEPYWIGDSLGTRIRVVGDINHDGVTDIVGDDGIYVSISP
jgi:hypothetical protein